MTNSSIWHEEVTNTSFAPLRSDLEVDVAIVGGGITGLSAAYFLSAAGKKVAVLEARKIGAGSTGYSTGNLYSMIGGEGMHTIKSKFNEDRMKAVAESRTAAVDMIEAIIGHYDIDCDFKRVPWCLFTEDPGQQSFVEKERAAAVTCGLQVSDDVPFKTPYVSGFSVLNQAQFNPLKYVTELSLKLSREGCGIYELTSVTDISEGERCVVKTTGGTVTAGAVVMATHTPLGIYFVQTLMEPYREYAVAAHLNESYPQPGVFWDRLSKEHYSMRSYDTAKGRFLMVLGEAHKVGHKENNEECFHTLETFLRERFSVAEVAFKWSAQQFKAADDIPYIGLSHGNKKIYIATGFAADGLVYGTLASMIISDAINGRENKWQNVYDAARITPLASAKRFAKENFSVARDLIKDRLSKTDVDNLSEIRPGEGKIVEVDGSKHGAYRAEDNQLHIVSATCPHMGCLVHFNPAEKSWDCPCHGSRFSIDGQILDGPAMTPLTKTFVAD